MSGKLQSKPSKYKIKNKNKTQIWRFKHFMFE